MVLYIYQVVELIYWYPGHVSVILKRKGALSHSFETGIDMYQNWRMCLGFHMCRAIGLGSRQGFSGETEVERKPQVGLSSSEKGKGPRQLAYFTQ